MFEMEVFVDGQAAAVSTVYLALACCSFQSGRKKPTQTFVHMEKDEGASTGLVFSCGDLVPPQKRARSPMGRQEVGALRMMTESEAAAMLIDSALPRVARRVQIRRIVFEDVTLRKIRITDRLEPFLVDPLAEKPRLAAPNRGAKRPRLDLSKDAPEKKTKDVGPIAWVVQRRWRLHISVR